MQDEIQARLDALKKELETGRNELQRVEVRQKYLREMVLRIEGAVQVLEELLEGRHTRQNSAIPNEKQPNAIHDERANA